MFLKEYVEMKELYEATTIEDVLTELMTDLGTALKANDEDEVKETVKGIFRYISANVLKVGRVESDRLIEKKVAEKVSKVLLVAKKFDVPVPANVEHRIENSVLGVKDEEETTTKTKGSKEYDHDEQLKKERDAKKKEDEEDKEAHKDLETDDNVLGTKIEIAKKKKKNDDVDDDLRDVDAFIGRITRKK